MARCLSFISVLIAGLFMAAAPAWADLSARLGSHDQYARLVFEWDDLPSYEISREGETGLRIKFGQAAAGSFESLSADSRIKSVTRTSSEGEPLSLSVEMAGDYSIRDFSFNNRLVLDIQAPGEAQPVTPSPAQAKKTEAGEEDVKTTEKPAGAAPAPPAKPEPAPISPEAVADAAPPPSESLEAPGEAGESFQGKAARVPPVEKTLLERAQADFEPHVVGFSATESVGVAAFTRNDYLWMIFDKAAIRVPPKLSGPSEDLFGDFERVELSGGAAYRMKLPEDIAFNTYGEGGGLVWRIVITPSERDLEPVSFERVFEDEGDVRGGSLLWPVTQKGNIITIPDPDTGDTIKVATVMGAADFSGSPKEFVDFITLESPIGLAVVPKVDELAVEDTNDGVMISRPEGLALSRRTDVGRRKIREKVAIKSTLPEVSEEGITRIFDFDAWQMGGLRVLNENQRILMSSMGLKDKSGLVEDLLTLAKMNIANDRGQEALGFIDYAQQVVPDLESSAEFRALRGAAYTLAGKHELAIQDLNAGLLKGYTELDYWRAFTLAWLEDWQRAEEVVPANYSVLLGYPLALLEKLGLKLAEVHLRAGEVAQAEALIAALNRQRDKLAPWTQAGLDYLKGEAHRQSEEFTQARKLWSPLIDGKDDFYRARAGLALTLLELERKDITLDKAIDRLEGLRYAWRGDELEAQINYQLGKLYLQKQEYIKGFSILREAAAMSPDSDIGREITAYMGDTFKEILMEKETLSPLDAVSLYEEFSELTPLGEEGNRLTQRLAERLVQADLLSRAAKLLQHQIDYRIEGQQKADVALRLAGIYLMNDQPQEAMESLKVMRFYYKRQPTNKKVSEKLRRAKMLEAKILAEMDKPEDALDLLGTFEPASDVNRLRADIAWEAGLWTDAAEALQDMIYDQALDKSRRLNDAQADLILNRAVALNLSGNRIALNNMRKRYLDAMKDTARGNLFDVITRPRQGTLLANRETLQSIVSEVDIFSDFLESYKETDVSQ